LRESLDADGTIRFFFSGPGNITDTRLLRSEGFLGSLFILCPFGLGCTLFPGLPMTIIFLLETLLALSTTFFGAFEIVAVFLLTAGNLREREADPVGLLGLLVIGRLMTLLPVLGLADILRL
jgi:hypothetical protein